VSTIALDVVPIFALIAIGWLTVRLGLLGPDVGDALGDFVFKVAVPVLLFRTVALADIEGVSPWGLWLAYFTSVGFAWAAGHLVAAKVFGRDARVAVVAGVSTAFSNIVFIGLPLVDRIVGEEGVLAVSIVLAVNLPVLMTAGTLMMHQADKAFSGGPDKSVVSILANVGRTLARNPLVIGLACGALYNLSGLPLTGVPRTIIDPLAGLAGPTALVSMGMALRKYGVAGNVRPAVVTSALKLFLMPAVVLVMARLLDLPPQWTAALVLVAAAPTGVNAYLISQHFGVGQGLASSVITLTTAAGVVTVSLWAVLLGL
jgi:malonate transporter and related proteins